MKRILKTMSKNTTTKYDFFEKHIDDIMNANYANTDSLQKEIMLTRFEAGEVYEKVNSGND